MAGMGERAPEKGPVTEMAGGDQSSRKRRAEGSQSINR